MIQVICFSRRRPLQLHGYLTSLLANFSGACEVSVLAKIDPEYAEAYSEVQTNFPQVEIVSETDFGADLHSLMGRADLTLFGCDDVVFVAPFDEEIIRSTFDNYSLVGFSLRLGTDVVHNAWYGAEHSPAFISQDPVLVWRVDGEYTHLDWAYPWEVDGTVYTTKYAQAMLGVCNLANPNWFEASGSERWREATDNRLMAAYPTRRLVVPTVNRVQDQFLNPVVGEPIPPESLLECWGAGMRMDVDRFAQARYEGIHVPDFYLRQVVA